MLLSLAKLNYAADQKMVSFEYIIMTIHFPYYRCHNISFMILYRGYSFTCHSARVPIIGASLSEPERAPQ